MSLLPSWIQTPGAAGLSKTLLHSLWEGTAVAIALAFALCCIRSSRARYAAACLAMLSLLGIFAFTLSQVMPPALPAGISIGRIPARAPVLPALDSLGSFVSRGAPDYVAWLVPFWITGVVIFQVRSMSAWIAATRMRRTGVCPAQPFWQSRLDKLGTCLRISRPVQLLESCLIQVPVVIGHLRPVILMPAGLLAGLPARQVEAILLHELAHVCRYDFLANLCQFAVESLLFYHPAAWWISGVIRTERENCCDDLVVEVQGGANEYAHALAALEFNRGPRQALAVTGGNLVKRIRRLLVQPEPRPSALAPVVAAAILTLTVMTAMAWQSKPATPAPQAPRVPMVAQQKQGPAPAPRPQAQPQPASVETPYDKWLTEDVAYIVADEERLAFRRLQTAEEKEQFIEQFWEHRDPTPGTVDNEFKEEHYRRVAYANQRFT